MRNAILLATLALLGLAGCNSVSSRPVSYGSANVGSGLQYSAPKALFSVELIEAGGDVIVSISEPFYVGDPNATFTLKASAGTFSDQIYDFHVDADTRLLSSIKSESLGRLDDVLVTGAEAFGAVSGYSAFNESGYLSAAPQTLYHRIIDPMMQTGCDFGTACDFTELMADLQAAAAPELQCAPARENGENRLCGPLRNGETLFKISLAPLFTMDRNGRSSNRSAKPCRGSICYRASLPYELRLRVAGVTDLSQIVHLPNESPVMRLNLASGIFADAKSNVTLVDGMPIQVSVDKENELAAAAAVPLNMVDALFSSASKVLALRVDYNNNQINALESETQLDQAKEARSAYTATRSGDSPASGFSAFSLNENAYVDDDAVGLSSGDDAEDAPTRATPAQTTIATTRPSLFKVTIPGN